MKTSVRTLCLQNKFVAINIIVVTIFLINTVFFHVYHVSSEDKEDVENLADRDLNPDDGDTQSRDHDKRSSDRRHNPGTVPDLDKMPSSDKWILVLLTEFNKSSHFNQSYLSFLDTIDGWTSIIMGNVADSEHGCDSCQVFPTTADHADTHVILFQVLTAVIKHGARQIYVMTSPLDVTSVLDRMTSSKIQGITYTGQIPFKPCTHFVQPLLGSGRSFSGCHDRNWVYTYSIGEFPDHAIIGFCQECAEKLPEALSDSSSRSHGGTAYCDPTTPNVAVAPERFVESVFENSLWTYKSFWAMFVYGLVDPDLPQDGDNLRMSFVVQRLLWEIYVSMTFIRSHDLNLKNFDSTHEKRGDDLESKMCREKELGVNIRLLGNYLYEWKCDRNLTIDGCALDLADGLLGRKLISEHQFRVLYEFVKMLGEIRYEYPERSRGPALSVGSYIGSKTQSLRFWPSSRRRQWNQSPFHSFCSRFEKTADDSRNASSPSFPSSSLSSTSSRVKVNDKIWTGNKPQSAGPVQSDIVVVIVFQSNDPAVHVQMANFYDFMYGRHFRHIVYCTSGADMVEMFAKMYPQPMTVIDLKESDSSLHSYLCMSEVMRMAHSQVSGYLHLNSNTLLNPWAISSLHTHLGKPWINAGTTKTRLYESEVVTSNTRVGHVWKDKVHGRRALSNSLQDLLFISKVIDKHKGSNNVTSNQDIVNYLTKYNKVVKKFLASFNSTKLSHFDIGIGVALVYYVPVRYKEEFIILADEFSRYSVHSYIAVPTLIRNLDPNFLELNGTVLTTRHTSAILSAYKSQDIYLHPWEMHLMRATKRSWFMCNTYLPHVDASLTEM